MATHGWWLFYETGRIVYNSVVVETSARAMSRGVRPLGVAFGFRQLLPCAPTADGQVDEVLVHSKCSVSGTLLTSSALSFR